MNNYQEEVLALQELEYDDTGIEPRTTPICASLISALSAISAASVSAAWNSGLTFGCGN